MSLFNRKNPTGATSFSRVELPAESAGGSSRHGTLGRRSSRAHAKTDVANSRVKEAGEAAERLAEYETHYDLAERRGFISHRQMEWVLWAALAAETGVALPMFMVFVDASARGITPAERGLRLVFALIGAFVLGVVAYNYAKSAGKSHGLYISEHIGTFVHPETAKDTPEGRSGDGRSKGSPQRYLKLASMLGAVVWLAVLVISLLFFANLAREKSVSTASVQVNPYMLAAIGIVLPIAAGMLEAIYQAYPIRVEYDLLTKRAEATERAARRATRRASRATALFRARRHSASSAQWYEGSAAGTPGGKGRDAEEAVRNLLAEYPLPAASWKTTISVEAVDAMSRNNGEQRLSGISATNGSVPSQQRTRATDSLAGQHTNGVHA